MLEKHLDKMPETRAFLEQVIESEEQYRIRKIEWAIRELEKKEEEIQKWKVLRMAGIQRNTIHIEIREGNTRKILKFK